MTRPAVRSPAEALVSLGSNIRPQANLALAVELLGRRQTVLAVSRVYLTPPQGTHRGQSFLNAAVRLATELAPRVLKYELLRPLEAELGRVRTADKNAPRTIDLDLSLYGELVLDEPGLRVPDPDVVEQAHVALPLADVAPDWVHPETGATLGQIAATWRDAPQIRVFAETPQAARLVPCEALS